MKSSGVTDGEKQTVLSALRKHFPKAKVLFFGSRFRGDHREYSDLDLCLNDQKPLDLVKLSYLKEELSDSNLSFKVDIADWNRITGDFKQIIQSESEPW